MRRPTWFGVTGVLLVAFPLLLATLLLFRFFGTERRSAPKVDSALVEAGAKVAQLEALESHLMATAYNAGATDFLVDLYRASRRLVAIALCGIVVLTIATVVAPATNPSIAEEVRGNADLIRILRGPEGPEGRQGPPGPAGICSCQPSDGGANP